jgi:hypothetical protein
MKVSELEDQHQLLGQIKVLIPPDIPDIELNLVGLNTRAVYVTSGWDYTDEGGAAGLWCKKAAGEEGRIFPVPCRPRDVLDWEVIDDNTVIPEVDTNAQYSPDQVSKESTKWSEQRRKWEKARDSEKASEEADQS